MKTGKGWSASASEHLLNTCCVQSVGPVLRGEVVRHVLASCSILSDGRQKTHTNEKTKRIPQVLIVSWKTLKTCFWKRKKMLFFLGPRSLRTKTGHYVTKSSEHIISLGFWVYLKLL